MGLKMREKQSVSREYARRYQRSNKKSKSLLLNEFVNLTGYRRDYASFLLRNWQKKVYFNNNKVRVIGDFVKRKRGSGRKSYYLDVLNELVDFWELLNYPCGKRLKSSLCGLVKKALYFKEMKISLESSNKLNTISASTIDRLLRGERKKFELRPKSKTRPGKFLKSKIPIRLGTEWNEDALGYLEIDLVSHDGGNAGGDFCQTLNTVDIKSGWTDMVCIKNKAQIWTFDALMEIKNRLPFPLKGIDSDNGSEFINGHLFKYCNDNDICFTRTRASKKNDNCYVEEKNNTAIRGYVGYLRYDTPEQLKLVNELYSNLRLLWNYFQPLMKLKSKIRIGSKIIKKYDEPKTPFARIVEFKDIDEDIKTNLNQTFKKLNPFGLKRNIDRIQNKIINNSYYKKRSII
jgi:hypothetical protein